MVERSMSRQSVRQLRRSTSTGSGPALNRSNEHPQSPASQPATPEKIDEKCMLRGRDVYDSLEILNDYPPPNGDDMDKRVGRLAFNFAPKYKDQVHYLVKTEMFLMTFMMQHVLKIESRQDTLEDMQKGHMQQIKDLLDEMQKDHTQQIKDMQTELTKQNAEFKRELTHQITDIHQDLQSQITETTLQVPEITHQIIELRSSQVPEIMHHITELRSSQVPEIMQQISELQSSSTQQLQDMRSELEQSQEKYERLHDKFVRMRQSMKEEQQKLEAELVEAREVARQAALVADVPLATPLEEPVSHTTVRATLHLRASIESFAAFAVEGAESGLDSGTDAEIGLQILLMNSLRKQGLEQDCVRVTSVHGQEVTVECRVTDEQTSTRELCQSLEESLNSAALQKFIDSKRSMVDINWSLERLAASIEEEYPADQFPEVAKLYSDEDGFEKLAHLIDCVDKSAQGYMAIRNNLFLYNKSTMKELTSIDNLQMCKPGGLKPAREATALNLRPIHVTQELMKDETIDSLWEDAQEAQIKLKELIAPGTDWAQKTMNDIQDIALKDPRRIQPLLGGGFAMDPGLKGKQRMQEKLQQRNGCTAELIDVSRLSVTFDDAESLLRYVQRMKGILSLQWLDNKFKHISPLGYSDVNVGATVKLASGRHFICELQLQHHEMFEYKQGPGHKLYEEIRHILAQSGVPQAEINKLQQLIVHQLGVTEGNAATDAIKELESAELNGLGIQSVVKRMWDTQENIDVQFMGMQYLWSLIRDSPEEQYEALLHGTLQATKKALSTHCKGGGDTVKKMHEMGENIISLLTAIQNKMRDKLQEQVEEAVKKRGLMAKIKERASRMLQGRRSSRSSPNKTSQVAPDT